MDSCQECGCQSLDKQVLAPKHSKCNKYWVIWNCNNCGSKFDAKV
jgi:hypothetical protein